MGNVKGTMEKLHGFVISNSDKVRKFDMLEFEAGICTLVQIYCEEHNLNPVAVARHIAKIVEAGYAESEAGNV